MIPLRSFIAGDLDDFDDEGVFLGEGSYAWKSSQRLGRGIHAADAGGLEEDGLLPREFRCWGCTARSPTVDGNSMICTLQMMQELYGMGEACTASCSSSAGVDADVFAMRLGRSSCGQG